MLIDTHAHLGFKDYADLEDVIERSLAAGVEKIICVSSNIADSAQSIEIARKYEGVVFAAVGIHPQDTNAEPGLNGIGEDFQDLVSEDLAGLERLIVENRDSIIAIGECGLDFTEVMEGERRRGEEEQKRLFRGQIELAKKYDLPILLHFNKTHDLFLDKYSDLKNMKGVFHCYVGGKKRLKRFLEYSGFVFGVTGLVTYDEGIGQVVKEIPPEKIVLETDSPFLAPLPHRGERNEPAYIPLIAQKVAEIKGVSLDEISRQTGKNVGKIFGI